MTDQELIKRVVEIYEETDSFKKTAAALHISTSKVRKALLTAGAWTNDTAQQIQETREAHPEWSDEKIAEELHISVNTVQMYTPYKLGPYQGDGPSAQRMSEYRGRNKRKMDAVDGNRKGVGELMAGQKEEEDPFDRPLDDMSWYDEEKRKAEEAGLPFSPFRHNPDPNAMPHVDDQFYLDYRRVEPAHDQGRHASLQAFHLRLEIDTDGMNPAELERLSTEYDVKTGWTRELIVPSAIPLHYLHYIIQRAFGFENVADHLFSLTPDDFSSVLEAAGGDELRSYCRLCGILFRFPYGNDEELYWDDDYDGKKSVRTWLKEKYEGSWNTNAGTGYGYADNQYRIWKWLNGAVPDFHVLAAAFDSDDFEEEVRRLGAPEEYSIGEMDGAPVPESGQFPFNNILESLSLEDLMSVAPEEWIPELEDAEYELLDNLVTLEKAREAMKEAEDVYSILERRMKSGVWDEDVLLVKRWRETAKKAAELFVLARGGVTPEPFTSELLYLYDFGKRKGGFVDPFEREKSKEPKWKIRIKLLEQYYDNSIYYGRNYTPSDATGARFMNDLEHEAEMADRLLAMCHWKEKLEVIDSSDRWIVPIDEADMMITLAPEQELLPEERERIEEDRRQIEEWRIESGRQKEREEIVDDQLYSALRTCMLEARPVCLSKEGTEPGEGYPDEKIRNTSVELLV